MRFKFNADQEFQIRAIESVTRLLDGQPRIEPDMNFALGAGFAAVSNRLDINSDLLLQNLKAVQRDNSLTEDETVACLEETTTTVNGTKQVIFANFSVEMETGTGKTYVYIRTALELFRRYGLRKYIVVVPSVAIREGVLKTLQMTESHLRALYDNIPYRYYVYDSANLSQVRQFALSDSLEMMIMTIDSFNKASNVIRLTTDRLQGETPIHLVQATRPILILDTIDKRGLKKRYLNKHRKETKRFFAEICQQEYTSELASSYQKRLIKNQGVLFTFLEYDGVPWNNNSAEHAIKAFADFRKRIGYLFTSTTLKEFLILLSVWQTCKSKGINFLNFLCSRQQDIDLYQNFTPSAATVSRRKM